MDLSPRRQPILTAIETEENATVHNRVYQTLRRELMVGTLKPGQVVSIRYLVDKFNISTTPARQVIERLQAERALIVGANRAPTVPILNRDDLRDLRDIRVALEGLATEKASGNIAPADLLQLEAHVNNMYRAIRAENTDDYLHNNWLFHHLIYQAAGSQLMIGMIETLWMRAGPLFRLVLPGQGHMENSMVQHMHALDAIRRGDAPAARAAIEADISGAATDLECLLPG